MVYFLFILLVSVYMFRASLRSRFSDQIFENKKPQERTNTNHMPVEILDSCASCGTYFSKKNGVVLNGVAYCSRDCVK